MKNMTQKEYVKIEGSQCPNCHSKDIEASSSDAEGKRFYSKVECNECHATWTDIFTLTGYDSLEVPEEKKEANS